MDFGLSREQRLLQKAAREFFTGSCPTSLVREVEESEKGHDPALWKELAELGWTGLIFPEAFDGQEMSFMDLAIFMEEAGRACLSAPFLSTVVGGMILLEAGSEAQKEAILPKISRGELIVSLAHAESGAVPSSPVPEPSAVATAEGFRISGARLFVPYAHVADRFIVAARSYEPGKNEKRPSLEEGLSLFLVDASSPGLQLSPLKTIAGDRQSKVIFDNVEVGADALLGGLHGGWAVLDPVLERASVATACETIGAAQKVLKMCLEYARSRQQFGHPIGSFQAVQHHLANMAIDVESSRWITYKAAWAIDRGLDCAREAAVAKAWTAEAYARVVTLAHRIHGAIGFTMEHDLQLFSRRAKNLELSYGSPRIQREVIAREIGLRRARESRPAHGQITTTSRPSGLRADSVVVR